MEPTKSGAANKNGNTPALTIVSDRKRNETAFIEAKDLYLSPVVAGAITFVLLLLSTWGTHWLEVITNDPRPFTLFFLIPVAFGSAYFGVRGGLTTAILSLVIARLFLFPAAIHIWKLDTVSDDIEMGALAFGTLTVAIVTGRLSHVLGKLRQANIDLRDSELRREKFSQEVLLAVTGGVLRLCNDDEINDLAVGDPDLTALLKDPLDTSVFRHKLIREVRAREIISLRLDDLCTAVTEASTNAVKHGNGGVAKVWFSKDSVSVLIQDNGHGISPTQLARATLERGFSTRVSLGMGYYMMIESVDSMALATSSLGTKILLTVGGSEKSTVEQSILAHYATV